jgi:hypothetical protein
MAKTNEKKPNAEINPNDFLSGLEGFDNWEEEQVGFPPYWNPELGVRISAKVIALDVRDELFHRWTLQATRKSIQCAIGPAEDAEPVTVKPGELFTCSAYAGLPLDLFVGLEVLIYVSDKRKLPGNEASKGVKRDLWVFKLLVAPESKKLLEERKAAKVAKQLEAAKTGNELF